MQEQIAFALCASSGSIGSDIPPQPGCPEWQRNFRGAVPRSSIFLEPLSGSCHAGFPAEHCALSRQAPVIAGELPAFANHTMARNHKADRILADSGADGAGGFWRAGSRGEIGISGEPAHRNIEQPLPDTNLEVRAD